jgi:hypothetical protein
MSDPGHAPATGIGADAPHRVENESYSVFSGRSFGALADQIAARICSSLGVSDPETRP